MQNVCHFSACARVQLTSTRALYFFSSPFTILKVFLQFKFLIFPLGCVPCHMDTFYMNTGGFSQQYRTLSGTGAIYMCARIHIGESDHHTGLNTLPDSIDRKRCNGMLCLSAWRERERNYHYQPESKKLCYIHLQMSLFL